MFKIFHLIASANMFDAGKLSNMWKYVSARAPVYLEASWNPLYGLCPSSMKPNTYVWVTGNSIDDRGGTEGEE